MVENPLPTRKNTQPYWLVDHLNKIYLLCFTPFFIRTPKFWAETELFLTILNFSTSNVLQRISVFAGIVCAVVIFHPYKPTEELHQLHISFKELQPLH